MCSVLRLRLTWNLKKGIYKHDSPFQEKPARDSMLVWKRVLGVRVSATEFGALGFRFRGIGSCAVGYWFQCWMRV